MDLLEPKGKTPAIFMEIDATNPDDDSTMMFYGHWDKQPHGDGWYEGLGPCKPVIRDGKLYGRGGSDDGYSIFSCVTAIKMIQE